MSKIKNERRSGRGQTPKPSVLLVQLGNLLDPSRQDDPIVGRAWSRPNSIVLTGPADGRPQICLLLTV